MNLQHPVVWFSWCCSHEDEPAEYLVGMFSSHFTSSIHRVFSNLSGNFFWKFYITKYPIRQTTFRIKHCLVFFVLPPLRCCFSISKCPLPEISSSVKQESSCCHTFHPITDQSCRPFNSFTANANQLPRFSFSRLSRRSLKQTQFTRAAAMPAEGRADCAASPECAPLILLTAPCLNGNPEEKWG